MRGLRHIADVYEPSNEVDSRGQKNTDAGSIYLGGVPCSLETLNTREQEAARQQYASASHKVCMYADPKKPIKHTNWLMIGGRKLNIAEVKPDYRGLTLELLCGEVVA